MQNDLMNAEKTVDVKVNGYSTCYMVGLDR